MWPNFCIPTIAIFLNEYRSILIQIRMKFVPKDLISNKAA